MKRIVLVLLGFGLSLGLNCPAFAVDKDTANAMAKGAATLSAESKREMLFKALAYDENCGEALYELGKLFQAEHKDAAAAEFFLRASQQFAQNEAADPSLRSKRSDADLRVKALNPYAARFTALLENYTSELNAITKKQNDNMTLEEASDRVEQLKLSTLPPDKGPKFSRPAAAAKPAPAKPGPRDSEDAPMARTKKPPAPPVPADIEAALKKSGWNTASGTWTRKSDNVYEVTDGKVEATKTVGAVQVILHKGGTGSVKIFVRNSAKADAYGYASGFGFVVEGASAKLMTAAAGYSDRKVYPYLERTEAVPDNMAKNVFTVKIEGDGKMEYLINGANKKRANFPIPKEGTFMIEVDGTCTIEMPQAGGQ